MTTGVADPMTNESAVEEVKNAEYTVPMRAGGAALEWVSSVPYDLALRNAEKLDRLRAERSAALDLLAVIHRDGGHHTEGVGFIKSCSDAIAVRNALVVDNDRLRAENERQRKRANELQAELHTKNDL